MPPSDFAAPHAKSRAVVAKSSLCVLGVDPGLRCTGYAVIDAPRSAIIEAGLIRSREDRPLEARLQELAEGLEDLLAAFEPDLVAVEELYSHYKHPRTAILMGHVRGIVLLAAARRGIEVANLPATRIKKTLTGNGHASKAQMQRAIQVTFGLSRLPEPADVADAAAIAWCAGAMHVAERSRP